MRRWLVCRRCGSELDLGPYFAGCPRCGGTLEVTYDYAALDSATVAALVARSSPARCAELLPVADADDIVTLGEGNTPLIASVQLGAALELEHCYLKNETVNPMCTMPTVLLLLPASVQVTQGNGGPG